MPETVFEVDTDKPPDEQPDPIVNRWHPDVPPAASVDSLKNHTRKPEIENVHRAHGLYLDPDVAAVSPDEVTDE